jgi:hypothetical protein
VRSKDSSRSSVVIGLAGTHVLLGMVSEQRAASRWSHIRTAILRGFDFSQEGSRGLLGREGLSALLAIWITPVRPELPCRGLRNEGH